MKKILLSSFVVLTFIIYSIQQRREATSSVAPASAKAVSQFPAAVNNSPNPTASTSTPAANGPTNIPSYKDGSYTGSIADAVYGYIQVKVSIANGKITDVVFLQYPNDRRNSIEINQQAMPYLKQEAINAQSARVDIVTGATDTSNAFIESLTTALTKAS